MSFEMAWQKTMTKIKMQMATTMSGILVSPGPRSKLFHDPRDRAFWYALGTLVIFIT